MGLLYYKINCTYVGVSNDAEKRHENNGEIKGCKYTT